MRAEQESPSAITKQGTLGGSPTKMGRKSMSPSKLNKSPLKRKKSPSKKLGVEGTANKRESGLMSPTSITMQNTFIIKNADESFDAYFAQMRKRRTFNSSNLEGHSATLGASPGKRAEGNFGVVAGICPAPRDGHSCDISESGLMFVYGGDRHHMPFNDLYLMQL